MTEIPPEIVENAATDPVQAALQVLDAFVSAVNASDAKALFRTLNFPHIRMASERVAIWNNEEEDVESYLKAFAGRAGSDWHHSTFDSKEVPPLIWVENKQLSRAGSTEQGSYEHVLYTWNLG